MHIDRRRVPVNLSHEIIQFARKNEKFQSVVPQELSLTTINKPKESKQAITTLFKVKILQQLQEIKAMFLVFNCDVARQHIYHDHKIKAEIAL